jgi:hypothetical protein
VLASAEPLHVDLGRIRSRLADPAVSRDLEEWDPVSSAWFEGLRPADADETTDLLTDDRPQIEFYLLRSWSRGIEKPRHSLW